MNPPEALVVSAICLFALLGIFLTSAKKSWRYGFGWLGLLFLLLAVNLADGMLLLNGTLMRYPRLAFWEDPFALLYGPLIYFFTLHLRSREWTWHLSVLLHLLPFIAAMLAVAAFHVGTSSQGIASILDSLLNQDRNFIVLVAMIPFFAHVFSYMILARRTLVRHREELQQHYSSVDLDWAFQVIQMVVMIFLISFLTSTAHYSGLKNIYSILLLSLNIISVALTLRLLLKAMRQPLFQPVARPAPVNNLSAKEADEVKAKIIKKLSEEKLFTNPELTIKDLAREINVPDRIVSQVINKSLGKNFYDIVNDYRISEACHILDTDPDRRLTVLEVVYRVGFNSKSSFNTQFKKKTGLTPSGYKAKQKI